MDHLQKLRTTISNYLLGFIIFQNVLVVAVYAGLGHFTSWDQNLLLAVSLGIGLASTVMITRWFSNFVLQPVRSLWQAILHLSPTDHGIAAPTFEDLKIGRELVTSLTAQVYQLVDVADKKNAENSVKAASLHNNFIANNLPLPLVVLDNAETITFANQAAADYLGMASEDMIGKNVYMAIDMSFPSNETFDSWLRESKLKNATATKSWERIRLNVRDDHPARLFDLAAYYNRNNPEGHETMLVLFDHTKQYSQDDQSISFMALSVHEMRTPLTLLRGYIEVFEDEFKEAITDPELQGFMLKMRAQAEQLTAYVNNILNVARVDNDQLELKLQSEDWARTLRSAVEMLSLRAKVRGIKIECTISTSLPPVGLDKLSISEVISNLIDNAIKYSGESKLIKIETRLNKEGMVQTTIQDYGLGIPASVLPNLFTKFYRDHRNRAQIGGTGLGLYLSKAIVTAHGGSLWVRSTEGEGSIFGFTLLPYAKLAATTKQNGDQGITRSAHGWIKNHSLYRH